jgi:hypothetical protein
MRTALILSFILFSSHSFGQWAIVKDADGFVNVRTKPSAQSNIVDTLSSGQIIYILSDPEGEWYYIDGNNKRQSAGYIHKSRLQLIKDFPKFKIVKQNDSTLKFRLDSMLLTIKIGKFQKKNHFLKFDKDSNGNKFLSSIDNVRPLGVDGEIPTTEYKYFTIKDSSQEYLLSNKYWRNLYEPNLSTTDAYFDKINNIVYIDAGNSDGAGGYSLLLVISDDQLIDQEIWTP